MIPTRSALRRSLTRGAAALFAVLVAVGGSPLPPAAAIAEPGPQVPVELPEGVRPSIAYEEAMAYADHGFEFEPGGLAHIPVRPRPDGGALADPTNLRFLARPEPSVALLAAPDAAT